MRTLKLAWAAYMAAPKAKIWIAKINKTETLTENHKHEIENEKRMQLEHKMLAKDAAQTRIENARIMRTYDLR